MAKHFFTHNILVLASPEIDQSCFCVKQGVRFNIAGGIVFHLVSQKLCFLKNGSQICLAHAVLNVYENISPDLSF